VKRRLGYLIVALSLLLLAATAAMWVRSYWWADWVFVVQTERGRHRGIWSNHGAIVTETVDYQTTLRRTKPGLQRGSFAGGQDPFGNYFPRPRGVLGFAYIRQEDSTYPWHRTIRLAIPYWSIALPLSIRRRSHFTAPAGAAAASATTAASTADTTSAPRPTAAPNAEPHSLPLPGTPGRGQGRGASDLWSEHAFDRASGAQGFLPVVWAPKRTLLSLPFRAPRAPARRDTIDTR
jgi:hypothetical protein